MRRFLDLHRVHAVIELCGLSKADLPAQYGEKSSPISVLKSVYEAALENPTKVRDALCRWVVVVRDPSEQ